VGLSDWFRRGRSFDTPSDLRDALIDAIADRDDARLTGLLNQHGGEIRARFEEWKKLPDSVRNDRAASARYAEALITIASIFERAGDASLVAALTGPADGNPIEDWNRQVNAAQELLDGGRAGEAVEVLTALVRRLESLTGTAPEYYRPRVLGKLGVALHRAGDGRRAVEVTREARELCVQAGDDEGIKAYTQNLEQMGAFYVASRDGSGATYAVVFRDDRGRALTLDELGEAQGTFKWEIRGGPPVPPDADALHQQGRQAGARGEYDQAMSLFSEAAARAPSWPYPVYDRAFTHLLKGDFDSALADYRTTMQLAPDGFFTAPQSVDMLAREAAGEFPRGLYATFVIHGPALPDAQRQHVAEQIVEQHPGFMPAWELLINRVADASEQLAMIERALAANPDRHTKGGLLVRKAIALSRVGERARAEILLRELISSQDSAPVTEAVARFALITMGSDRA